MFKHAALDRRTAIAVTLSVAAMTASAASVAGPGCIGTQPHRAGAYYPYGPAMPPAAYRPVPPAAYPGHVVRYPGMMAPSYQQPPVVAQPANAERIAAPAAASGSGAARVSSNSYTLSGDNQSAGENITVRINGMRFEPSNITVKPGTTVTWIHGSSMPHTISGDYDGLRSGTLYGGQQFSHTFDTNGRYDYACDLHPSMKGSVVVEGSGTGT